MPEFYQGLIVGILVGFSVGIITVAILDYFNHI